MPHCTERCQPPPSLVVMAAKTEYVSINTHLSMTMIQPDIRTCQHQHPPINNNDSARHRNIFYQLWFSLNLYRSEQVNINTTLPMIVIQPHNRTCDHKHTPTTDMIQSDIKTCQNVLQSSKHWSPHTTSKRRNSLRFHFSPFHCCLTCFIAWKRGLPPTFFQTLHTNTSQPKVDK